MITPTVGRMMWYYECYEGDNKYQGPLAAVVAWVRDDGKSVNLTVYNKDASTKGRQSVPVVQEGEAIPAIETGAFAHYCAWMPFQLGQAKKTEQAEAVAAAAKKGFHEGSR